MSIQSEIDRINQAKTDLAAAIESKGVTVPPNTTINVYPGLVQQIEQGAGLPTGGTPGQMLYQGASGPEWGDRPVIAVKLTQNSTGQLIPDKTGKEIYEAYQAGNAVIAYWYYMEGADMLVPLLSAAKQADQEMYYIVFSLSLDSGVIRIVMTDSLDGPYVIMSQRALTSDASHISFTPGATGLTSDNVQDAIEEVNAKATPKSVTVTLPASGWSSNTQTVTVNGVLADESAQLIQPMPAMASQSAYYGAGVLCSGQAANSLTFTCQTVPTADLTVYVVMQEVGA